jgi:hypothetical protein
MKTKTHFAFRIDIWNHAEGSIVEHVAGVAFPPKDCAGP